MANMQRLADQLGDMKKAKGWNNTFSNATLHTALARIHLCLEVEYGSPGATRSIYAGFLAKVGRPEATSAYQEDARPGATSPAAP